MRRAARIVSALDIVAGVVVILTTLVIPSLPVLLFGVGAAAFGWWGWTRFR